MGVFGSKCEETVLDIADKTLALLGHRPFIHYLGKVLAADHVAALADRFASALASVGIRSGDRFAVQLQNMPQFVVAALGIWKLGACLVPVNPMTKADELRYMLMDSGARGLLQLDELWEGVGRPAITGAAVEVVLTTSGLDYADESLPDGWGLRRLRCPDTLDFKSVIEDAAGDCASAARPSPSDVAALVYTSGTTGPAKGAMVSHANLSAQSRLWSEAVGVTSDDVVMAVAPLFHITGLVANVVVSMTSAAPLVLTYRFDPARVLDEIEAHRATFVVAAITAYSALMGVPEIVKADLSSLRVTASGGAPVAPALARRWFEKTGHYIRNCYGLTETTSLVTMAPAAEPTPVDEETGALSVGRAVGPTRLRVDASSPASEDSAPRSSDGSHSKARCYGEVLVAGPQVVSGYWEKPSETDAALVDGWLRTGDIGFVDDDGWLYLVDRKKDLIVTSGYKVWPREVEDVLTAHEAVREVAVAGLADDYRGEAVTAFVTCRAGAQVTPRELIQFCRDRLATYKCPRQVHFVDELPKTETGKILRRVLRSQYGGASEPR